MTGFVIDAHGRALPEGSRMMTAGGRGAGKFDELPDGFLNSGFIYLLPLSHTLIVAFSPHLVIRRTVASAFFEIARQSPHRVDLLCYGVDRNWRETLCPASVVFERIDRIVGEAVTANPRGLVSVRLRLDVIDRVGGGRLSPVFEAWAQSRGQWTPEIYGWMCDQNLLDRTVVARNPVRSSQLIIEHWGKRRDLFGLDWMRRARGSDVEAQPYPGLAAWVAAGMREAITGNEPRLETVQSQIRPAAGRIRRRHYDRLLLPWTTAGGDALATTINIPRKGR